MPHDKKYMSHDRISRHWNNNWTLENNLRKYQELHKNAFSEKKKKDKEEEEEEK